MYIILSRCITEEYDPIGLYRDNELTTNALVFSLFKTRLKE